MINWTRCATCKGSGDVRGSGWRWLFKYPCKPCKGTGWILEARRDTQRFPPPPPPQRLVGALQDKVHKDLGQARPAKSVRHQTDLSDEPDALRLEEAKRRNADGGWLNPLSEEERQSINIGRLDFESGATSSHSSFDGGHGGESGGAGASGSWDSGSSSSSDSGSSDSGSSGGDSGSSGGDQ